VGADIYLYDKRREDLDARIKEWLEEPLYDGIMARLLGRFGGRKERSIVDIWNGGIDETSRVLAKEYEELQETHYFRDSYNASSLFWRMGLSWWGLLNEGYIDDDGIANADTVQMLLEGYNQLHERVLSKEATTAWYAGEVEKGTHFDPDEGPDEWVKYFQEKGKHFAEFCQRTLDNNGYWECSV
jgi:hypothetical protein